jgi:hypothetical protein
VRILGLPLPRPNAENASWMLCRHSKYLQEFSKVRDLGEIPHGKHLWEKTLRETGNRTGRQAASVPPDELRRFLYQLLVLKGFKERER